MGHGHGTWEEADILIVIPPICVLPGLGQPVSDLEMLVDRYFVLRGVVLAKTLSPDGRHTSRTMLRTEYR